jgi:predicted N-acetyltransferase YhbS
MEEQTLVASIFFSRLTFPAGEPVYMLAPLAVATDWQGRGVGQSLVRYGLGELHRRGVSVAVTYGDVAFYGKVGFEPLSEEILPAPMDLSMPFGWLGQSLNDGPIEVRDSRPACVEPFRDPAYW